MKNVLKLSLYFIICLFGISCAQNNKVNYKSPQGYNLREPEKHRMPEDLLEISGITFNKGNPDTVYAIQDEEGKLFYGRITAPRLQHTKFSKHGDYEDVAICNNQVIVLKSNGKLYTFSLANIKESEVADVREQADLVPAGEYESLYANQNTGKVYVLCKNCSDEKTTQSSTGYILDLQPDGTLKPAGQFKIEVAEISKITGDDKIKFRPSAIALNPVTKEWYIVSSVNKLLVVADASWHVTGAYELNSKNFIQPEGIAFDKKGNMYISNEGDEFSRGNILEFKFFAHKK